jgi:MFS family permease
MSWERAWPSSLSLELEARRLHGKPREAALHDTAAALVLARMPAFFDLFACSMAAVLVFPRLFFPGLPRTPAVLAGLALAILPLAMSPLGAGLAKVVGRRHGRGVGLTGGQFILGASTTAVAFLPTHAQAGSLAIVLLVGCRLVQGLSAGAAWGEGPVRSGGRDLAALSAMLGLVVAAGPMAILAGILSAADFADWGWRYPFAIGFAINIVALFANLRLLAAVTARPARQA